MLFDRVIQELKKIEKRTHLDAERFYEFCRYHQAMLFPAFQLQLRLQELIMGTSFWRKCTNRRVELSKGTYVTMGDLMEMVSDDEYAHVLIILSNALNWFDMNSIYIKNYIKS